MIIKYYLKRLFQNWGLLDNQIYKHYSSFMTKRAAKKNIRSLHPLLEKYGKDILNILFESEEFKSIPLWLEYGTLLGAVRNNDFIPHDIDIDMGMYAKFFTEDFQKNLENRGFVKDHQYYFVDHLRNTEYLSEISYHYNGLNIDFFLSWPINNENNRIWYSYYIVDQLKGTCGVVKSTSDNALPLEDIILCGIHCKAPSNPRKHLIGAYGKNYMTPDPNWNPKDDLGFREYLDVRKYNGRVVRFS